MPIETECNSCGRQYQAPDELAGKRVRCKGCGNIFEIPGAASQEFGADLDALAELEKSHGSMTGMSGSDEDGGYSDDEHPRTSTIARQNVRFSFPLAKEIDHWAPTILTLGGLLWLGLIFFQRDESRVPWIPAVRLAVAMIAYTLLVVPLTLSMIHSAGRKTGFQMPVNDWRRAFAAYMPGFALACMMWIIGGGDVMDMVLGCFAGLIVSTAAAWLLFRLRPHEVAPTGIYAGIGFVIGVAVAGGIAFGINLLLIQVLIATKKPDVIPASPLGPGFAWLTEDQKIELRAKPAPPTPRPVEVVDAPPTQPANTSPVVRNVNVAPITTAFDDIIWPLVDSPYLATIRTTGGNVMIESWDADTWTQKGSAPFTSATQAGGNRYVLSTNGDEVARIASFPRLSVQVWSFSQNRITSRLDLDSSKGSPELIGFVGANRLLVLWQKAEQITLEVSDVTDPAKAIALPPEMIERRGHAIAVSRDGRLAAIATKLQGVPSLLVYELQTGRRVNTAPITSLDPRWPVAPTGFGFSPDSRQLAVLFEQAGNALLLTYQLNPGEARATQLPEHVYPSGLMGGRDVRSFVGNALQWLPDGRGWLLYGQGVFASRTGYMIADLGEVIPENCRVRAPGIVEAITRPTPRDTRKQITSVQLNMEEITRRER